MTVCSACSSRLKGWAVLLSFSSFALSACSSGEEPGTEGNSGGGPDAGAAVGGAAENQSSGGASGMGASGQGAAMSGGSSSSPTGGSDNGGENQGIGGAEQGGGGATSSAGGLGGSGGSGEMGGSGGAPRESFSTLREAAANAGVRIGAAVGAGELGSDTTYRETLAREFDYVTPENSAKWGPLAPTSTSYSWGDTDALVNFAEENAQAIKGHTFVWHIQTPSWIATGISAAELGAALKYHIETTLERYRGRIRAWDVVNEAVNVGEESGYTDSVFYQVLGPDYIADAFRWARAADPDIELIYNEVGIERMGPKADFTYQMIKDLLDDGVPIDAIGFQSHVSTHRYPSEDDMRANIRRYVDLGLKVNISEVDARTKMMPGDQEARWHAERIAFQQIVASCVVEPGCDAITFWGHNDRYSWINDDGDEDALIYDRNYMAKPAYDGVMDGLRGMLPVRGTNLLLNGDFAAGAEFWLASGGDLGGGPAVDRGGQAACISARSEAEDGLVQVDLLSGLAAGGPLSFSAWARLDEAGTVTASLIIDEEGQEQRAFNVASRPVEADVWTQVSGYFGLGFEATPTAISLKVHGPGANVELCVADVSLQSLSVE